MIPTDLVLEDSTIHGDSQNLKYTYYQLFRYGFY